MFQVIDCPNYNPQFYLLRDPQSPNLNIQTENRNVCQLVRDGEGNPVKFDTEQEAKDYEAK